jgi:hypothetical protein
MRAYARGQQRLTDADMNRTVCAQYRVVNGNESRFYSGAEESAMMNSKWNSRLHISAAWLWGAGLVAVGVACLIHH